MKFQKYLAEMLLLIYETMTEIIILTILHEKSKNVPWEKLETLSMLIIIFGILSIDFIVWNKLYYLNSGGHVK